MRDDGFLPLLHRHVRDRDLYDTCRGPIGSVSVPLCERRVLFLLVTSPSPSLIHRRRAVRRRVHRLHGDGLGHLPDPGAADGHEDGPVQLQMVER